MLDKKTTVPMAHSETFWYFHTRIKKPASDYTSHHYATVHKQAVRQSLTVKWDWNWKPSVTPRAQVWILTYFCRINQINAVKDSYDFFVLFFLPWNHCNHQRYKRLNFVCVVFLFIFYIYTFSPFSRKFLKF